MKNAILILLTCMLITVQAVSVFTQVPDWVYPIKPGTEEWKKFKTMEERYEALRIPDDVLQKMTISQLLKAWMDYPLRNGWGIFNSYQADFENQIRISSALAALLEREDAGKEILKEYNKLDPSKLNEVRYSFDFVSIEMLISQKQILNRLTLEDKKQAIKKAIDSKSKKEEAKNRTVQITGLTLIARVLDDVNNTEFKDLKTKSPNMAGFIKSSFIMSDVSEKKEKIYEIAAKFIKNK